MTWKQAWNRRSFLSMISAAGVGMASAGKLRAAALAGRRTGRGYEGWPDGNPNPNLVVTGFGSTGDPITEMGLTPVIDARGTITGLGGSLMPPEVMAVMRMGSNHFCNIDDLERAAGRRIAEMLKFPAGFTALITSGAAGAILAAWAGMITDGQPQWIRQIPDVSGMPKTEVIIQKKHRYAFDHQIRQTGAKLVEVVTRQDMERAIGPRTLGAHFLNLANGSGEIKVDEFVKIAHAGNIPCFNDCAADTPPISRLWEYVNLGYDMVTFSGGKDIRGPQCAGLLFARESICANALKNMSPQEDTVARPCKVGKEEIFGMLKALELFLHSNQEALTRSYYARLGVIARAVEPVPTIKIWYAYNQGPIMNRSPFVNLSWDATRIKLSSRDMSQQLLAAHPFPIHAITGGSQARPQVGFTCWQLKPGQEQFIADRLVQIFHAAGA